MCAAVVSWSCVLPAHPRRPQDKRRANRRRSKPAAFTSPAAARYVLHVARMAFKARVVSLVAAWVVA